MCILSRTFVKLRTKVKGGLLRIMQKKTKHTTTIKWKIILKLSRCVSLIRLFHNPTTLEIRQPVSLRSALSGCSPPWFKLFTSKFIVRTTLSGLVYNFAAQFSGQGGIINFCCTRATHTDVRLLRPLEYTPSLQPPS